MQEKGVSDQEDETMAARVIDVLTPAGRQFERILQELADKEVAVGFQHGDATEEEM